ncbi:MAG: hypothetical protein JHC87_01325 [Thermoleophilaceae bacterium]|nr:hypothetical protein [Thermoleophilaceae bacterium]
MPANKQLNRWIAFAIFGATVLQLAVATFATGLPQFEGKAFGSRLVAYPLMMAALPGIWTLLERRNPRVVPVDWTAVAFVWAPFLVDVTGNTADLYDSLAWWDDANHLVNWLLLCTGAGLILRHVPSLRPWELAVMVTGIGAILAILWELAEWYTFIRHGTELATAYEDTLGDLALGTLGGLIAGLVLARRVR